MRELRTFAIAAAAALLAATCATAPEATVPPATDEPQPSRQSASPTGVPTPTPVGSAEGSTFTTVSTLAGGKYPLPISLEDTTGLVTGLQAVEPAVPFGEGISTADGGATIRYEWVGGACDTRTELRFERVGAGFRLVARTTVGQQVCILIGLGRHVVIHLSLPIEEASLELVEEGR